MLSYIIQPSVKTMETLVLRSLITTGKNDIMDSLRE